MRHFNHDVESLVCIIIFLVVIEFSTGCIVVVKVTYECIKNLLAVLSFGLAFFVDYGVDCKGFHVVLVGGYEEHVLIDGILCVLEHVQLFVGDQLVEAVVSSFTGNHPCVRAAGSFGVRKSRGEDVYDFVEVFTLFHGALSVFHDILLGSRACCDAKGKCH